MKKITLLLCSSVLTISSFAQADGIICRDVTRAVPVAWETQIKGFEKKCSYAGTITYNGWYRNGTPFSQDLPVQRTLTKYWNKDGAEQFCDGSIYMSLSSVAYNSEYVSFSGNVPLQSNTIETIYHTVPVRWEERVVTVCGENPQDEV